MAPRRSKYNIAAIASGTEPEKAFAPAFGETVEKMDTRLRLYVARAALKSARIPLPAPVAVENRYAVRAIPDAEAEARLAGLQLGVQRLAEAAPRIEAAAAAAPDIAETQLELGLLRVQQERLAAAWPPLERAAALAPDDFLTSSLGRFDAAAAGNWRRRPRGTDGRACTRGARARRRAEPALGRRAGVGDLRRPAARRPHR